jgi:amidophosphoribosyltransferase
VKLLRDGGAKEVHVRVSSPPVRHPCFMGIDMATYKQLIAHNHTIEEICQQIGADSLAYLSVEGLSKAVMEGTKERGAGHCNACFSGQYPVVIPSWLFEEEEGRVAIMGAWGRMK